MRKPMVELLQKDGPQALAIDRRVVIHLDDVAGMITTVVTSDITLKKHLLGGLVDRSLQVGR